VGGCGLVDFWSRGVSGVGKAEADLKEKRVCGRGVSGVGKGGGGGLGAIEARERFQGR